MGLAGASLSASPKFPIRSVSVSHAFFNPTIGQHVRVDLTTDTRYEATVLVLDRDGGVVRRLGSPDGAHEGRFSYSWDGRDDAGEIVPNEAYSFKIDVRAGDRSATYFPAAQGLPEIEARVGFYDRVNGTLGYSLPKPARVHLQAGTSRTDPRTKQPVGPSLRTIVNREPRPAGSVLEQWDGFDESGDFYVPDLLHFSMSLVATPLPENSVITVGSAGPTFLEYAARAKRASLLPKTRSEHRHHQGLSAIEDTAPALLMKVKDAEWSESEKAWLTRADQLTLTLDLSGPSARQFARQPGGVLVFVGDEPLKEIPVRAPPLEATVSLAGLTPGPHRVTANWISDYGSVAVNSLRISVRPPRLPRNGRKQGER